MPQINNLEKFTEQIEELLRKYRTDPVIAEKSVKHQQNLERLLNRTNKLLEEGEAVDSQEFENLVKMSENSFKQLKEQNKNDKEFQKQFKKNFGQDVGSGSLSKRVVDNLSTSLSDISRNVKVLNQNVTKDAGDTALAFGGGPLAKMAAESIDFKGIANSFRRNKGNQNTGSPVMGQFHDGIRSVPKEGSYYLDQGERVIPADTNNDFSDFIDDVKNRGLKIFSEQASKEYFEPLSKRFEETVRDKGVLISKFSRDSKETMINAISKGIGSSENLDIRQHRETIDNLRNINESIQNSANEIQNGFFLSARLQVQRFMRHPILNTIAMAMKPLARIGGMLWRGLLTVIRGFRTSINEKILKATKEQTQLMETGRIERQGFFQRGGVLGAIMRDVGLRNKNEGMERVRQDQPQDHTKQISETTDEIHTLKQEIADLLGQTNTLRSDIHNQLQSLNNFVGLIWDAYQNQMRENGNSQQMSLGLNGDVIEGTVNNRRQNDGEGRGYQYVDPRQRSFDFTNSFNQSGPLRETPTQKLNETRQDYNDDSIEHQETTAESTSKIAQLMEEFVDGKGSGGGFVGKIGRALSSALGGLVGGGAAAAGGLLSRVLRARIGKMIPGIGTLISGYNLWDAYNNNGDMSRTIAGEGGGLAGGALGAKVGSLILPGIGTIVGGASGYLIGRMIGEDIHDGLRSWLPDFLFDDEPSGMRMSEEELFGNNGLATRAMQRQRQLMGRGIDLVPSGEVSLGEVRHKPESTDSFRDMLQYEKNRSTNLRERGQNLSRNPLLASPADLQRGISTRTYTFTDPEVAARIDNLNQTIQNLQDQGQGGLAQSRFLERERLKEEGQREVNLPRENVDDILTYFLINSF